MATKDQETAQRTSIFTSRDQVRNLAENVQHLADGTSQSHGNLCWLVDVVVGELDMWKMQRVGKMEYVVLNHREAVMDGNLSFR